MPTVFRDVRFQGQSGKHLLALSFSGFDPTRTWDLGQGEIGFAQILAGRQANPQDYWRWCLREGPYQENCESHPGERFNTLNKPAKPSGRGQGLRSTGSLARSTFLLFSKNKWEAFVQAICIDASITVAA